MLKSNPSNVNAALNAIRLYRLQKQTDKALELAHGGGYLRTGPVERLFRDAKVTELYEGTSEIQRIVIAREVLKGA